MSVPLKKNEMINVVHIVAESTHAMPSTDVYTDYYGLSYIVSGDRKFITSTGIYFVHPKDVSFVNIGLYHRTAPLSNQPYERYGIKFTYEAVKDLVDIIGESSFEELMTNIVCSTTKESKNQICNIFIEMLEEYKKSSAESQLILVGMLHKLLVVILRNREASNPLYPNVTNIKDELIMKALYYIDNHIYENTTSEELAAMVGLSYSQFSRRFLRAIGSSYSVYLAHLKVIHAQIQLTNTHDSIEKISNELGFCNPNYFCSVFHKYTGLSPRAYRKEQSPKLI